MIPKTRYGHRTDAKRSDGGIAPDGTVPRTIPFGQRISGLAADGQELHAPMFRRERGDNRRYRSGHSGRAPDDAHQRYPNHRLRAAAFPGRPA